MFLRESLGVSRDVSICKSHYCRIYVRNLGSWKFFGKQIWPIHFLAQNLLELVQNIHLWWFISHGFFLIFKGNSWEKSIHSIGVSSSFIVPSFGHFLGHNLARKIPPSHRSHRQESVQQMTVALYVTWQFLAVLKPKTGRKKSDFPVRKMGFSENCGIFSLKYLNVSRDVCLKILEETHCIYCWIIMFHELSLWRYHKLGFHTTVFPCPSPLFTPRKTTPFPDACDRAIWGQWLYHAIDLRQCWASTNMTGDGGKNHPSMVIVLRWFIGFYRFTTVLSVFL